MEYLSLPNTDLSVSRLIFGCMGLAGAWHSQASFEQQTQKAELVILKALECGFSFFDHADIYAGGRPEQLFGNFLAKNWSLRKDLVIQSKCGIRQAGSAESVGVGRYDFSREHIEASVLGSLGRLQCQYLDILLLHRPDPLMDIFELAEVLDSLSRHGLVRYFGVSNFSASQIQLLQSALGQKLVSNQLELSLVHHDFVEGGILVNQPSSRPLACINDTINYCQLHGISLQAWGALAQGRLSGRQLSGQDPQLDRCAAVVAEMALVYETSKEAIVLAWLMKHPAKILPVIGSTQLERIELSSQASSVAISREDWYKLFTAIRGKSVP